MKKTKHYGLYYRFDKNKNKVYVARLYINGKETTKTLGKEPFIDLAKANQLRLEVLDNYKHGMISTKQKLDKLFIEYIELRKASLSFSWYYGSKLNWNKYLKKEIGNLYPQDIKVKTIQKIINDMLDSGKAPNTAKQIKDIITGLYKYLPNLGVYGIDNIGKRIHLPKFDNSRNVELTDKEIEKLFSAIFNYDVIKMRTIFIWLLHGRRKNEVLTIKWEDIDINNNTYRIKAKSTNKFIYFALTSTLLKALKEYGIKEYGYVFPSNTKPNQPIGVSGADYHWKEIRVETGFKNLWMHDLRHILGGFGVNDGGFNEEKVGSALGHTKGSKVTSRYASVRKDSAKAVVDSFFDMYHKDNSQ